jgi:hypothetical protein
VHDDIEANPALLFGAGGTCYPLLLTGRTMLPLRLKRQWLQRRLAQVVGPNGGAAQVQLHGVDRSNPLGGLCAAFGIDEASGAVVASGGSGGGGGAQAGGVEVQFAGENGVGDGVRREWFQATVTEIVDLGKEMFLSKDGGRTLQPNPHSALTVGAEHLSYFALLGRIAGCALFHNQKHPCQLERSVQQGRVRLPCRSRRFGIGGPWALHRASGLHSGRRVLVAGWDGAF